MTRPRNSRGQAGGSKTTRVTAPLQGYQLPFTTNLLPGFGHTVENAHFEQVLIAQEAPYRKSSIQAKRVYQGFAKVVRPSAEVSSQGCRRKDTFDMSRLERIENGWLACGPFRGRDRGSTDTDAADFLSRSVISIRVTTRNRHRASHSTYNTLVLATRPQKSHQSSANASYYT